MFGPDAKPLCEKESIKRARPHKGPIGAEIESLPEGYNTLTINGEQYYELDGIYYMPSLNENNQEILVAISNPGK